MFRKAALAVAVLALVATAVIGTSAASVMAADPTPSANRGVVIGGTGVLDAQGSGIVGVKGSMDLHATVDNGMVLIRDVNNNAAVHVTGNGQSAHWLGFTVYFGVSDVTVVANDAGVIIAGKNINLRVAGRGWAFLKGEGTFSANGHGPFPWTRDGAFGSVTP